MVPTSVDRSLYDASSAVIVPGNPVINVYVNLDGTADLYCLLRRGRWVARISVCVLIDVCVVVYVCGMWTYLYPATPSLYVNDCHTAFAYLEKRRV